MEREIEEERKREKSWRRARDGPPKPLSDLVRELEREVVGFREERMEEEKEIDKTGEVAPSRWLVLKNFLIYKLALQEFKKLQNCPQKLHFDPNQVSKISFCPKISQISKFPSSF